MILLSSWTNAKVIICHNCIYLQIVVFSVNKTGSPGAVDLSLTLTTAEHDNIRSPFYRINSELLNYSFFSGINSRVLNYFITVVCRKVAETDWWFFLWYHLLLILFLCETDKGLPTGITNRQDVQNGVLKKFPQKTKNQLWHRWPASLKRQQCREHCEEFSILL